VYNPSSNTWDHETSLPTALAELKAVISGNTIYAIGGTNGSASSLNQALQVLPVDTVNVPHIIPVEPDPTVNRKPLMKWHRVDSATSYMIEVSQTSLFSSLLIIQQATDTFFLPLVDLPQGNIYWRVRCNLNPNPSLPDHFYIQNDSIPLLIHIKPDTIAGLSGTVFAWHRSTGAANYRLLITRVDSFQSTIVQTFVTDTCYVHNVPMAQGTYVWTVSTDLDYNRTAYPDTFWVRPVSVPNPQFPAKAIRPFEVQFASVSGEIRVTCFLPGQAAGETSVSLFDIQGKSIRAVFSGVPSPGCHRFSLPAKNLAPGVYCCRVRAGDKTKMVLTHVRR
jgi:hypothetical protein